MGDDPCAIQNSSSVDRRCTGDGNMTLDRRRFLAGMWAVVAASRLGATDFAHGEARAASGETPPTQDRGQGPFGPLKNIQAGVLSVGYAEAGPPRGHAVILLHGWPYDIHAFVEVVPFL